MPEKTIRLDDLEPMILYGAHNVQLNLIKDHFPKLRIVARGNELKVIGEAKEIAGFEKKISLLSAYYSKNGTLNETILKRLLNKDNNDSGFVNEEGENDVILFGTGGTAIRAKTENQKCMVLSIQKKDMLFAIGPAGSGKTYTAVALAVRALKNKEVKRIILTRPAVEAGENLGFLPGDLKEKLDPYLQPLYDALYDMIPADKLEQYIETQVIQVAPLAFMRGRTLDNAFVILDEAQNTTRNQMKMFLTRMGTNAKFIITGDSTQIDLPKNQPSGLIQAMDLFKNTEGIDFVFLNAEDIIRHKLVKEIIAGYEGSRP